MICKDNQTMIDTLLRLKNPTTKMVNRFGSYTDSIATRPIQCAKTISELMDHNNNQNKIASTNTNKIGELAEFQALLKAYIH